MQKILALSVAKPLLLMMKAKVKLKYVISPAKPTRMDYFNKSHICEEYNEFIRVNEFITDMDILIMQNGDIILTVEEMKLLQKYTEK